MLFGVFMRAPGRGCQRWATAVAGCLLLVAAGPSEAAPLIETPPGAGGFPEALREQLATELASRGPSYVPRTRNLRPDGSPRYTNRLLLETSPYLLQHAHNPVNWYPWGDAAFAEAARLDRPVLLSIGYSTCHWCHVMEEETFDDPELAAYLNAHFIAVKVDREARPDVDAVYMAAIHALGSRGGWPLNVFVTPDRKPFYAGTYFPPEDRGQRIGFPNVLRSIVTQYTASPDRITQMSTRISAHIARSLGDIAATATRIPDASVLVAAEREYVAQVDPIWGGIGRGTKFPSSLPVRLLLRLQQRSKSSNTLALVNLTLDKMAAGGLQDHLAGGFHRYSTEPRWLIPHFEKMLYDNALIASSYIEAAQATGREDFKRVARRTLDYAASEMTAPEGGFHSATDADSAAPSGEMEEGWFFTWTPTETAQVLGAGDAGVLNAWFGVTEAGQLDGRSILHTWRSMDEVADDLAMTPDEVQRIVDAATPRLLAARGKRPPPLRDEKVIAAWNGLMISAFARAGFVFRSPEYTRVAIRAAEFVLKEMRHDGRLVRVYKAGRAEGPAFLEDYAFLIAGLIDLYEADGGLRWLREAIALQAVLDRHHLDDAGGGYFKVADDHEALLAREKPNQDGAIPSGNSVAALNLVRLAALTSDSRYSDTAVLLFSAFADAMTDTPTRLPEMLLAVDMFLGQTKEIVLVRPQSGAGEAEMLATLRTTYLPNRVIAIVTEGRETEQLSNLVPLVSGKIAQRDRTTAYVCENKVCAYPTADPVVFARQLRGEKVPR